MMNSKFISQFKLKYFGGFMVLTIGLILNGCCACPTGTCAQDAAGVCLAAPNLACWGAGGGCGCTQWPGPNRRCSCD